MKNEKQILTDLIDAFEEEERQRTERFIKFMEDKGWKLNIDQAGDILDLVTGFLVDEGCI